MEINVVELDATIFNYESKLLMDSLEETDVKITEFNDACAKCSSTFDKIHMYINGCEKISLEVIKTPNFHKYLKIVVDQLSCFIECLKQAIDNLFYVWRITNDVYKYQYELFCSDALKATDTTEHKLIKKKIKNKLFELNRKIKCIEDKKYNKSYFIMELYDHVKSIEFKYLSSPMYM